MIFGVAGQVKSAQAFDGQNFSGVQAAADFSERFGERRAAHWAGVGLGVETAVRRILVFAQAIGAHREDRHGGLRAIVGDVLNDAVTRAAIGAVGEGIEIAAVGGIGEIGVAIVAGADVGRDHGELSGVRNAVMNGEGDFAHGRAVFDFDVLDFSERRRLDAETEKKIRESGLGAFDFRDHASRDVEDVALQIKLGGEAINERTEADALHGSTDMKALAMDRQT